MGMIQTIMRRCPDNQDNGTFLQKAIDRCRTLETQGDDDGDRPEHATAERVTLDNFEEAWKAQEDIRPEFKEKYRDAAAAGRVILIEVDW